MPIDVVDVQPTALGIFCFSYLHCCGVVQGSREEGDPIPAHGNHLRVFPALFKAVIGEHGKQAIDVLSGVLCFPLLVIAIVLYHSIVLSGLTHYIHDFGVVNEVKTVLRYFLRAVSQNKFQFLSGQLTFKQLRVILIREFPHDRRCLRLSLALALSCGFRSRVGCQLDSAVNAAAQNAHAGDNRDYFPSCRMKETACCSLFHTTCHGLLYTGRCRSSIVPRKLRTSMLCRFDKRIIRRPFCLLRAGRRRRPVVHRRIRKYAFSHLAARFCKRAIRRQLRQLGAQQVKQKGQRSHTKQLVAFFLQFFHFFLQVLSAVIEPGFHRVFRTVQRCCDLTDGCSLNMKQQDAHSLFFRKRTNEFPNKFLNLLLGICHFRLIVYVLVLNLVFIRFFLIICRKIGKQHGFFFQQSVFRCIGDNSAKPS